MATPAELLEGLTLDSGWYVAQLMPRTATQTGGAFSSAYKLTKLDGSEAFLKAMDFEAALGAPDPAAELKLLADAYTFEREIVELCGSKRLSRVVRALGSGKIMSRADGPTPSKVVQYLLFELAEGDLRQTLSARGDFNLAWTLKCLHEVFAATQQLHVNGIAHQDIKPSNILGCGVEGAKLADLGRAWHPNISGPHDWMPCAGAYAYAAPESLYKGANLTETERRYGADFYLLGSIVLFMFTGLRMTAALMAALPIGYTWRNWGGTYDEVLPSLEHAFVDVLQSLELSVPSTELRSELVDILQQMCQPDVRRRGDKGHKSLVGSRFQLQRLISRLYTLYMRAKLRKISDR